MKLQILWFLITGLGCTIQAMSFAEWKEKFGRHINSSNEAEASEAFNKTVAAVKRHNMDTNRTYDQKIGEAAGMTEKEKNVRTGYRPSNGSFKLPYFPVTLSKAPKFLNLTSRMSPIKKQGRCGSCWVMSATATMEYWNPRQIYSDQGILDCNKRDYGCGGGTPSAAFFYAMNSGLADGLQYRYVSGHTGNTSHCRAFEFPPIYNLKTFCFVRLDGNETMLRLIVAEFGPVVVSIDARNTGLDHYASGVFASKFCSNLLEDANHAITIVGYGTDAARGDYWIARNSWGTDFGHNGYFQIKRGDNMCGVGNRAWGPC